MSRGCRVAYVLTSFACELGCGPVRGTRDSSAHGASPGAAPASSAGLASPTPSVLPRQTNSNAPSAASASASQTLSAPSASQTEPDPDPPSAESASCHGIHAVPIKPMASLAPRAAPSRELLATLSATQRQDLKLLSRLCEPAVISAHEAPVVGCSCCPPFDMCLPTSDGAVRGEGDVFPIVTRSTGAFSGPGQREYAVTFDGCEPHSSNWGGTALYRESPEGLLFLQLRVRHSPIALRDRTHARCARRVALPMARWPSRT